MFCQSAPPASSPAPRLRARSMFSLGTEVFFAFWMASYSVGLPAGSPPPVRAATSMFLISRANSLPRRASLTAFWCFVVAHLEWPLIVVLSLASWPDESTWPVAPREGSYRRVYSRNASPVAVSRILSTTADDVDEQLMHAAVARHLRVKRRRQRGALANSDDVPRGPGQYLHAVTGSFDPRRADEHRAHRRTETRERDIALKRV